MNFDFLFFFEAVMLGIGLAMDAFTVSLANGLNEPHMKKRKMCGIAAVFAIFQAAMPLIGWVCVKTVVSVFGFLEALIPWFALGLLGSMFIGFFPSVIQCPSHFVINPFLIRSVFVVIHKAFNSCS